MDCSKGTQKVTGAKLRPGVVASTPSAREKDREQEGADQLKRNMRDCISDKLNWRKRPEKMTGSHARLSRIMQLVPGETGSQVLGSNLACNTMGEEEHFTG